MRKILMFFGLFCLINLLNAQQTVMTHQDGQGNLVGAVNSVNISADDVQFWVGSGSNSTLVCIGWDHASASYTPTVVVWGVRWNGNIYLVNALDSIAAYDSRFTYSISGGFVGSVDYNDPATGIHLSPSGYYNCNSYGGAYGSTTLNSTWLRISESTCNDYNFSTVNNLIYASNPGTPTPPTPEPFSPDDILYWVGSGTGSSIVAVSWDEDEVALAWGVRYDEEYYPSVIDLLDTIDTYDPRFDYHVSYYMSTPYNISSISFTDGDLTLSQTNTSNIQVQVLTSYGDIDAVSGSELEDYSIWDGDFVQISTAGLFDFSNLEAVEPPAIPVEPDTLCTTVHPLTYSEDFSSYTSDQSMRPYFASAPIPECWTVLGNGTVHHVGTGSSTDADYFGGVGYSTSTNSFGAVAANDAFFNFIASQIYTGSNTSYINDMLTTGTRRYAVLPTFDSPLSQTVLTFDHRTNIADANTHLVVGYIVNDTADFVALETYAADNKVLHHDTIRFSEYANVPADARLTLMWDVASTTASTTGPGNRYCGIDNLTVALANPDTTVNPVDTTETLTDATISADDIIYWIGEGDESAIFVLNIDTTSVAWGYHFDADDEPTIDDMIADIDAADPRLAYTISWETDEYTFYYVNHPLKLIGDNFRFKVNGTLASDLEEFEDYDLSDNMTVVVSTLADDLWNTPIVPATVATMPVDATISADEILYWVGEGSNEAVIAINWGVPDTALAWGLRFNGDLTVTTALQALVAGESRLTTNTAMSTFDYNDGTVSLSFQDIPDNYMQFILNGNSQAGLTNAVTDGAFLKVGESAFGIGYDSTAYAGMWYPMGVAWPTRIYPVTAPDTGTTPIDTIPTPEEATIAFSDILYWVGEGSNEAVMAVNWADTALAWGYRWNGTATVANMMADIAAADPRFSYELGNYSIDDILFTVAEGDTLRKVSTYWESKNNGVTDAGMGQTLNNGDFEKWAEPAAGIVVDSTYYDGCGWSYSYVYTMTINPVSVPDTTPVIPVPEEATIAFSEILYWVGEGSNEAVMAVNWADTALAWGYRWNGTATVSDMMADIAAADPRFSYELGSYGIDDILFVVAEGDTLRKVSTYWESRNNGVTDAGMGQTLNNGDFEKWAEPAAGIVVDSTYYDGWGWSYSYVYTMTINPVSVPDTTGSSIDNHEMSRVYAYPNPCTSTLYVTNESGERVALYDMNGKLLEVADSRETQIILNMQQHPAGLYLLKVGNDVQKILKK